MKIVNRPGFVSALIQKITGLLFCSFALDFYSPVNKVNQLPNCTVPGQAFQRQI